MSSRLVGGWRPPALVAAAVLALVLVGCGSSPDALHTVVTAATTTLAQSAGSTSTLRGAAAFGAAGSSIHGRGAFLFPSGLGYEAVATPQHASRASATVYFVFLPKSVLLSSVAGVALPAGKSWISAPAAVPAPARYPHFVAQVEGLNPQLLLDELAWGATAAVSRGEQVIDHIPYVEYAVSINLRRAVGRATGAAATGISAAIKDELSALAGDRSTESTTTVPLTVWIDGPGHVAQLRAVVPGSGLGTISIVLDGFGATVPTNLPPQGETVGIAALKPTSRSPWVFGGGG